MDITKMSITLFLVMTLAISSNCEVLAASSEVSKTTNYGECIYEELCEMGKSGTHECIVKCSKKNKKYTGGKCIPKNPEYGYCCCTI
ncbi:unnamed protein product [Brassica oleracea var. botrytis]|uniref:(rape) hypothetical protein n=1 Tax=Brassica napus TaxID=3708 RepID=A0A816JCH9_BRANA|nr:unnamed protein product [Brassica napus]